MKGYSPTLNSETSKEVSSKIKQAFIELGAINSEHDENCDCEECSKGESDDH